VVLELSSPEKVQERSMNGNKKQAKKKKGHKKVTGNRDTSRNRRN